MPWKRIIGGTVVLLFLPTIVLAVLAACAAGLNGRAQTGLVTVGVSRPFALPGGAVDVVFEYHGSLAERPPELPPPRPLDMAMLIDVSSSVQEHMKEFKEAARESVSFLAEDEDAAARFAVVAFHESIAKIEPWTEDLNRIDSVLGRLRSGGGTNPRDALREFRLLRGSARPNAKVVLLFFTDGELLGCHNCPGGAMGLDEILSDTAALREDGVDIYSVGVPDRQSNPLMFAITGESFDNRVVDASDVGSLSSRVLDPANVNDLKNQLSRLVKDLIPKFGDNLTVRHALDRDSFETPSPSDFVPADSIGWTEAPLGFLPYSNREFRHSLIPRRSGFWPVGTQPSEYRFLNTENEFEPWEPFAFRPYVLVVGYLPLLLLYLPALLWLVYQLLRLRGQNPEPVDKPALLPPRLAPKRLPTLPVARERSMRCVPTLYVGIGGLGISAVEVVRSELLCAMGPGLEKFGIGFAGIDLDSQSRRDRVDIVDPLTERVSVLTPPMEVASAEMYLPGTGKPEEHLRWFSRSDFDNATREELDLSRGAHGDRMLARLALFQWLSMCKPGDLIWGSRMDELLAATQREGAGQIIFVAGSSGGVGTGWISDLAIVTRRYFRKKQSGGTYRIPDSYGILVDNREWRVDENRSALLLELESALQAGQYPRLTCFVPGNELLDAQDMESPFNTIFEVSGETLNDAAAQCGALSFLLSHRDTRRVLTTDLQASTTRKPVLATTTALGLLPDWIRHQIRVEILSRFLGPDLLDLAGVAESSRARKGPREAAADNLQHWIDDEHEVGLVRSLLGLAADPSAVHPFVKFAGEGTEFSQAWLAEAFAESLTRQLRPGPETDRARSEPLRLMEAKTLLEYVIDRLGDDVLKSLGNDVFPEKGRSIIASTLKVLESAASDIQRSLDERDEVLRAFAVLQQYWENLPRKAAELGRIRYLLMEKDAEKIRRSTETILYRWAGRKNTKVAVRERIHYAFIAAGDGLKVTTRLSLEELEDCETLEKAYTRLRETADVLAASAAIPTIAELLHVATESEFDELVKTAARRSVSAPACVVVSQAHAHGDRLERMKLYISRISGTYAVKPAVVACGDLWAVRKCEFTTSEIEHAESPRLCQVPEQIAERQRLLLSRATKVFIPSFSVSQRAALSHSTAWKAFCRSYRDGKIRQCVDDRHVLQWFAFDLQVFLTEGSQSGLDDAAAAYVRRYKSGLATEIGPISEPAPPRPSFDALTSGAPSASPDDLCRGLIALTLSEEE